MRWEQKVQYAALSDVGFRRRNNQDACVVMLSPDAETFSARGHLFIVADGMGGHAVGELASKIAVDTIPHAYFKNRIGDIPSALMAAIHDANTAVHEKGSQNVDFNRMGTTCVALALGPQGAVVGHVGDSRLYRVRRDQIDQMTFDHSLEWELIRHGRLKPNEQLLPEIKHVITRSIGPEPTVEPEVEGPFPVLPGDIFLACSDGLSGQLKDAEIGAIAKHLAPVDACRLLVNLANLRGGPDNITVIIAQVGALPEGVAPLTDEETKHDGDVDHTGWLWFGGMLLCALTFALGLGWAMLQDLLPGATLAGLSAIAAVVVSLFWRRHLRTNAVETPAKMASTILSKAYRSASAKLVPEFLELLCKLESDLKQAAEKERWTFDVAAYDSASKAAKSEMTKKQLVPALKEVAKSLDVLMVGLGQHRKSLAREADAKKPSNSNGHSS